MSDSEKPKSSWRERRQSIKHKWLMPFIFPEWLCERVSYFLGQWAFLDILGHAGRLTILVAVIFYFAESGGRRKAKHYQAWQVINAAQGKTGSGGRMEALQDLHRDGISLAGVDISKACLPELNLENAFLIRANFSEAILYGANLAKAELTYANLAGADLSGANLAGVWLSDANLAGANLYGAYLAEAYLRDANLAEAILYGADLAGADLLSANLTKANLSSANLTKAKLLSANLAEAYLSIAKLAGADLSGANLAGADLFRANLSGADLRKSNLKDIKKWQKVRSIKLANIHGVKNRPEGFIEWATEHGAVNMKDDKEWKKLLREKEQEKTKEK